MSERWKRLQGNRGGAALGEGSFHESNQTAPHWSPSWEDISWSADVQENILKAQQNDMNGERGRHPRLTVRPEDLIEGARQQRAGGDTISKRGTMSESSEQSSHSSGGNKLKQVAAATILTGTVAAGVVASATPEGRNIFDKVAGGIKKLFKPQTETVDQTPDAFTTPPIGGGDVVDPSGLTAIAPGHTPGEGATRVANDKTATANAASTETPIVVTQGPTMPLQTADGGTVEIPLSPTAKASEQATPAEIEPYLNQIPEFLLVTKEAKAGNPGFNHFSFTQGFEVADPLTGEKLNGRDAFQRVMLVVMGWRAGIDNAEQMASSELATMLAGNITNNPDFTGYNPQRGVLMQISEWQDDNGNQDPDTIYWVASGVRPGAQTDTLLHTPHFSNGYLVIDMSAFRDPIKDYGGVDANNGINNAATEAFLEFSYPGFKTAKEYNDYIQAHKDGTYMKRFNYINQLTIDSKGYGFIFAYFAR